MLVLASASPRRHALLEAAGIAFRVVVPEVEEDSPGRGDPQAVAIRNAAAKVRGVEAAGGAAGDIVLGADTVVAVEDRLLGKPRDEADARAMLRLLSGTTHRVVTGVALLKEGRVETRSVETRVTMRELTDDEIAAYAGSGEAMGKAGAYAIQETGDRLVERVDGPYDNVVGLPVATVRALMGDC